MFFRRPQKSKNQGGFTLIELIVVVGIFLILSAAAFPVYHNWQASSALDSDSRQVVEILRDAQAKSSAGFNNSAYGVYFDRPRKTLTEYQGRSYAERDRAYDQVSGIDSQIAIPSAPEINEINFSAGLGQPDLTGDLIVSTGAGDDRTISINNFSNIEIN